MYTYMYMYVYIQTSVAVDDAGSAADRTLESEVASVLRQPERLSSNKEERMFIELITSDRKLKASRKGSK